LRHLRGGYPNAIWRISQCDLVTPLANAQISR
jgi:hypothetical protein